MEYRIHPKTGDRISVIGIGTGPIFEAPEKEAVAALAYAHEQGINYADFATAGAETFRYAGMAFASVRKEMFYQVHFGANYETGEYGWTTSLDKVKRQVDWQLKELKTDYIDFGFIHCLDSEDDWKQYQKNGVLDYLFEMKKSGVVRHIGLSTHTPELAQKILDTGLIEQLMFSINPAYDYQHGEFAFGSADERMKLYRRCEAEGIGISVMKPYSGGQLLDERTSPFGKALTEAQCIQYALDKPGIQGAVPFLDRMIVLDYIIANEDRHFNNFGVLREAETLKWLGFAPIYDSGSSLGYDKTPMQIRSEKDVVCKPFKNHHAEQLKLVSDFSWIDFDRLEDVGELIESVLTAEGAEDYMDEIRIRAITGSVKRRIGNLSQLAMSQTPVQEHSTEDDVEENIAADYAPKKDM